MADLAQLTEHIARVELMNATRTNIYVVRGPDGDTLIDPGPVGTAPVLLSLDRRGEFRLARVVLTHAHPAPGGPAGAGPRGPGRKAPPPPPRRPFPGGPGGAPLPGGRARPARARPRRGRRLAPAGLSPRSPRRGDAHRRPPRHRDRR